MAQARHHATPTTEARTTPYELSDVNSTPVIIFAVSIALLIGTAIVVVIGLLGNFQAQAVEAATPLPPLADTQQLPPAGPRLQTNPERDLRQLQAADQAVLHSYGWVDKAAGKVHIPIEQAIDLLLEREGVRRGD